MKRATKQGSALAQLGTDAVRHSAQQLRDQASSASKITVNQINDEPVKTVLIIAAASVLFAAIVGLTRRLRKRDWQPLKQGIKELRVRGVLFGSQIPG